MNFCDLAIKQLRYHLFEPTNTIGNFLCCSFVVQQFAIDVLFADVNTENRHCYPYGGSKISLTHSSSSRKARPTIPSDLLCRKMLPAADLDYELEAQG